MRVLYLLGTFKPKAYDNGVIDTRLTPAPSVWNVVLKYAKSNSDRCYFYIATYVKSTTPGRIEYLSLKDIRGCMLVIHVASHITDISMMTDAIISLFNYDETFMPVDAVLTVLPTPVYTMRRLLGMNTSINRQRPAIIVRATEGALEGIWDEYGFVAADKVLTTGLHMEDDILREAIRNFSFATVKKAHEKFVYLSHGVSMPKDKLVFERGKVIGYFGRFDFTHNHVDTCFEALDKVYRLGIVDKVIATSSKVADGSSYLLKQYPYVQFSAERQDYVLKAQEARCTIMYVEKLACPLAMIELMGYGLLPVVYKTNRSWVKYFFKHEIPDYPFLFDTTEEMVTMVKAIMEDDELYKKWAKKVSEYIQDNFDLYALKRKMHDEVIKTVENMQRSPLMHMSYDEAVSKYGFCKAIVDKVFPKLGCDFTGEQLVKAVKKENIALVTKMGKRFVDNRSLFHFVESAGYEDTMDSPVIRFRKKVKV